MIRPVATVLLLTLGANFDAPGASGTLCPGLVSNIAEDHQVHEDQLTFEGAVDALAFIKKHYATTDQTLKFGLHNSEVRIHGYLLRKSAMASDAEVAKRERQKFCQWLKTAAWFD